MTVSYTHLDVYKRQEISRKYNDEILGNLIENSGLKITQKFLDSKNYFADYILTKS